MELSIVDLQQVVPLVVEVEEVILVVWDAISTVTVSLESAEVEIEISGGILF